MGFPKVAREEEEKFVVGYKPQDCLCTCVFEGELYLYLRISLENKRDRERRYNRYCTYFYIYLSM